MGKTNICLYFQVHQPNRIKKDLDFFSIGELETDAFDHQLNQTVLEKVARRCYLPANALLLKLLNDHPEFKVSFSISGVILEQFELFAPEVITSFQKLVSTGRVELLAETYYHSLSFVKSKQEFREQVRAHEEKLQKLFGVRPTSFRNTELIYNNDLAFEVKKLGYDVLLAEGVDKVLKNRSVSHLYAPFSMPDSKLLLKNYKLSDDIAFRFRDKKWGKGGLTAKKYLNQLLKLSPQASLINLFLDYETFGEHQWEEWGIFNFLADLPQVILANDNFSFITPYDTKNMKAVDIYDCPDFTSWADEDRDLSAWLGNPMQKAAVDLAYEMEDEIKASKNSDLIADWRKLLTSDHAYYLSTKGWGDGAVHSYFSPYEDPYKAYMAYMNALHGLKNKVTQVSNLEVLN